ncbi:sugar-binding transcriptional regulator [Saccharibacillus alkalitolerans]|uniref:Sugar-binding transcriptional regulator n=1 Tax=Saccharibacillus alkalitolerans TaxID=2705290 RepID=A0ABX0EZL5_9BACL|nr:sugar-binding transcriptional regulator [Saccharibacillus alkalitolerans]NGZ74086.1 sugar-binding transcriptional regulator [Saccharibacillus alkalitolerans]
MKDESLKLMTKICKLYYYEAWTQEKLAEKFGISRPNISKIIQKAREIGVVEIIVHDDPFQTSELEKELESRYGLRQVLVVPTRDLNKESVTEAVGRAAAQFVQKLIKSGMNIGVSWGNTLYHMVREFPLDKKEQVRIIPLIGGSGSERTEVHANQIAYELSKKIGAVCDLLYAPSVVETDFLYNEITAMPGISGVLREAEQVDLALVGIGNPFSMSTMERFGYLSESTLDELRRLGTVADINSRFIDRSGLGIDHPINKRIVGVDLEQLRRIGSVVGFAFGQHKVEGILAALRGGYLHMLVTDETTASQIAEAAE